MRRARRWRRVYAPAEAIGRSYLSTDQTYAWRVTQAMNLVEVPMMFALRASETATGTPTSLELLRRTR